MAADGIGGIAAGAKLVAGVVALGRGSSDGDPGSGYAVRHRRRRSGLDGKRWR